MKRVLLALSILLLALVIGYFGYLKDNLMVVNGYAAKNMCSCVFVAGLNEETVKEVDLGFSFIGLANPVVDYELKSTTSDVFGLVPRKAVYREGLGCVLLNEIDEQVLRDQYFKPSLVEDDSLENWFERIDTVDLITNDQQREINAIIASAFENDPDKIINTRAIVILYKGQLIGERYADGISKDTRLLGWSMTKSLTSTMAGLLVRDGAFALEDQVSLIEWTGTDKGKITYKNLLQMSSGLKFEEDYGSYSDANIMLWVSDTMGAATVRKPLEAEPSEKWYYSSGTTNLLMKVMAQHFADRQSYLDYLNKELFDRIGAYSFLIEPDASGHFVGSSFGWATARDWARVGQLYLNNGSWGGVQILPESWVSFVQQPPADSEAFNKYGGQFWLSGANPGLPEDAYYMNGFHGQSTLILPSEELVIVRLGVTYGGDFGFPTFVNNIIDILDANRSNE